MPSSIYTVTWVVFKHFHIQSRPPPALQILASMLLVVHGTCILNHSGELKVQQELVGPHPCPPHRGSLSTRRTRLLAYAIPCCTPEGQAGPTIMHLLATLGLMITHAATSYARKYLCSWFNQHAIWLCYSHYFRPGGSKIELVRPSRGGFFGGVPPRKICQNWCSEIASEAIFGPLFSLICSSVRLVSDSIWHVYMRRIYIVW